MREFNDIENSIYVTNISHTKNRAVFADYPRLHGHSSGDERGE